MISFLQDHVNNKPFYKATQITFYGSIKGIPGSTIVHETSSKFVIICIYLFEIPSVFLCLTLVNRLTQIMYLWLDGWSARQPDSSVISGT